MPEEFSLKWSKYSRHLAAQIHLNLADYKMGEISSQTLIDRNNLSIIKIAVEHGLLTQMQANEVIGRWKQDIEDEGKNAR